MRISVVPPIVIILLVEMRKNIGQHRYLPEGLVSRVAIHYQVETTQIYAMMRNPHLYKDRVSCMEPDEREQEEDHARRLLCYPKVQDNVVSLAAVREESIIRPPTKEELMTGRYRPRRLV